MQNAIDFVKDNPEVFAALVAAIGILGGIAGNWISAAVQAAGGRAQANAAVDAARISAEAQRMAALREDRKAQLAVFIRCARTVADGLYRMESTRWRDMPPSAPASPSAAMAASAVASPSLPARSLPGVSSARPTSPRPRSALVDAGRRLTQRARPLVCGA
ncbi:hypothetical protein [Streptomyces sp. NPDC056527]|uniref:hypothetical protein n=1 Tax=Streptomyces sp. NPDC056527 TaxID=3345853 RepID=UPI0036C2D388